MKFIRWCIRWWKDRKMIGKSVTIETTEGTYVAIITAIKYNEDDSVEISVQEIERP